MSHYERYLEAAERENTRRSYGAAVKHFEESWGGLLPATEDSLARYLADHAERLSVNTLKLRIAALGRWHREHGFPDPTKSTLVRRIIKGIGEAHPARERRARPLTIETLSRVDAHLQEEIARSRSSNQRATLRRACRDRALLLIGFWAAFRSDELLRICVDHVEASANEGMVIYLQRTKTVSATSGREFKLPALSRLCAVQAYLDWLEISELDRGPVFRRVGFDAGLGTGPLHPSSLVPLIRSRFKAAEVPKADEYSGHSLRRGFATWASEHGWTLHELMEYVGWKDTDSAMRYIERADTSRRERLEAGLAMSTSDAIAAPVTETALSVSLQLERYNSRVRTLPRARRYIERTCFGPFSMERLDEDGSRYRIHVGSTSTEELDETLADLLEQMHSIAADNRCFLEAQIRDDDAGRVWD